MKRPVLQSDLDIYFDHATGELPIWELDKDEAARVWRENFDARSWVFFNLPADSWVDLERGIPSGTWRPRMNDEDYEPFRRSLASVVPWRADDEVLFAATKAIVLQCTWETFLAHWQGFLYVYSDAPMLLSPQHSRQCIVFFADGRSVFIDATQPG